MVWIGQSLHHQFFSKQFSELSVILVVLGIFMVAFQFFNSFITSIYYYLFNDVVPQAFLARFMSLSSPMTCRRGPTPTRPSSTRVLEQAP